MRARPRRHRWALAIFATAPLVLVFAASRVTLGAENGGRPDGRFELVAPDAAPAASAAKPDPPATQRAFVARALHYGVGYLLRAQRPDGSWPDVNSDAKTATTSLVVLALLAAGERHDSAAVHKALAYLRRFGPGQLENTYAIALQTMVFADAEPEIDKARIAANAQWLERAQIRRGDPVPWPGSWTYSAKKGNRPGDSSNTSFALMGLDAACNAGVNVKPEVWTLARTFWANSQKPDRSWSYSPSSKLSRASTTCDGISGLTIARRWAPLSRGQESLTRDTIQNCGKNGVDSSVQAGIQWLADHFDVNQNFGNGQEWKLYYLFGLARAAGLGGVRQLGKNDWYHVGADELLKNQDKISGYWQGEKNESDRLLASCFAILFLGSGRTPVLINKLSAFASSSTTKRADPSADSVTHTDDLRNLCEVVGRDWKRRLSWQVVDCRTATADDLLRAPILFMSGHAAVTLAPAQKKVLREFVERGGTILAEACCGNDVFDRSFKATMAEMFSEKESQLRPLPADHPVWTVKHGLHPPDHPLWGIQRGGRTTVFYSPASLSCYWNQVHRDRLHPAVVRAVKLGQNVVAYATARKRPGDESAKSEAGASADK